MSRDEALNVIFRSATVFNAFGKGSTAADLHAVSFVFQSRCVVYGFYLYLYPLKTILICAVTCLILTA